MKKYLSTFLLLLGSNKANSDFFEETHLNWFPERIGLLDSEKSAEYFNALEKF